MASRILVSAPPGPLLGWPLRRVSTLIRRVRMEAGTSPAMVSACVSRCMLKVGWGAGGESRRAAPRRAAFLNGPRLPTRLLMSVQALRLAGGQVLEPVMSMEVRVEEEHLGAVLGDLAQRRGTVRDIQSRHWDKVLLANVPLAETRVGPDNSLSASLPTWSSFVLFIFWGGGGGFGAK